MLRSPFHPIWDSHSFPLPARSVGSNVRDRTLVNAPVLSSQGHAAIFSTPCPQVGSPVTRNTRAPKSPGAPAQLTIFFAGSACVYEDVSPEKAQAILSLARNSSSLTTSKPVTAARVQSQPIRSSLDEAPMLSFSSSLVSTQQVNTKQSIMTAVAIPQTRKVSLARFLERRKERMIKVSPYDLNKSCPELGSDILRCSAENSTGAIFDSTVSPM